MRLISSTLPPWLGDWWVYLVMLTIALILLARLLGVPWMISVVTGNAGVEWGLAGTRGMR